MVKQHVMRAIKIKPLKEVAAHLIPMLKEDDDAINDSIANFKTSPFAQYLRQAQILILEILYVFLWLKFSPSLILNKIEHFETASL